LVAVSADADSPNAAEPPMQIASRRGSIPWQNRSGEFGIEASRSGSRSFEQANNASTLYDA
jgi:hypothetical protein